MWKTQHGRKLEPVTLAWPNTPYCVIAMPFLHS